jgi:endo-1,4-beta-xylanase
MVKELNEKNPNVNGRPLIDGIGMQGHYRINTSVENVAASLERFASLRVEVSITELDVQAGLNSTLTEAQELEQGVAYARLFALFRKHVLGRVTMWGLDDGTSWLAQTSPSLFDRQLQPKPAFYGALDPAAFLAKNEKRLSAFRKKPQQADARYGKPALNEADPLWKTTPEIPINQFIMAWQGARGAARALWDEQYLYVLVTVTNAELNKANPARHEQDSVEFFIDEGNHKSNFLQDDDGQYRVNFDNEQSFSPQSLAAGFESQAFVSGKSYTIAAKIPFRTIKPKKGMVIGFDLQINGASERGMRQSIAVWNDTSGNAWQDPSCFGLLRLN